jgi:hypothetical protein
MNLRYLVDTDWVIHYLRAGLDHGVGHPVLAGLLTLSERGNARP